MLHSLLETSPLRFMRASTWVQVRQEQMREEIAHHKATVDFLVDYCLPIPNEARSLPAWWAWAVCACVLSDAVVPAGCIAHKDKR